MNRYKLFPGFKKTLECDHCHYEITVSGHTYERLINLSADEDNILCPFCHKGILRRVKKKSNAEIAK